MQNLLRHPSVVSVVSNQCQNGLATPGRDGEAMLAKNPACWASTSRHMLNRLKARCNGDHEHQHLLGGRVADAAYDPPELVTNI